MNSNIGYLAFALATELPFSLCQSTDGNFPIDFPEDTKQLIFMNNFNLKRFGHKKNPESTSVEIVLTYNIFAILSIFLHLVKSLWIL